MAMEPSGLNDRLASVAKEFVVKVRRAIWRTILSDKVRPFVWVYYVPLFLWGFFGTFFDLPSTYVKLVMGEFAYHGWILLHLFGTVTVMCGLLIEDRASDRTKVWHRALRLQTGGHFCMFLVLLAYEISAVEVSKIWGVDTYSAVTISPYVVGCLMLSVQSFVRAMDWDQR